MEGCYVRDMNAGPVTSYSPDREYRDGVLVERNIGSLKHSRLQARLAAYLGNRQREWNVKVYLSLTAIVRESWHPIADVCIYELPDFDERYPTRPPLLWIEILSPDDCMTDVWNRIKELVENGVPYVWIIDPETLES